MKKTSMKNILSGKPTAKKAPTKKTAKKPAVHPMDAVVGEPKTVRVTKAENGFTVSSYGQGGEQVRVAKDHGEMMKHCKDMLGC